jgi:Tol biopolymer transport system component
MTADGLYAVLGSTRTGSQNVDVWETSRATTDDPWPALTRTHMTMVNTSGSDHDPTISADGLHLYVAPDTQAPQRIRVAARPDRTSNFSVPQTINELFSNTGDADPSPTPDERILLFSSNRASPATSPAAPNVWYATRASATGTFSAPLLVPDINTDAPEGDPHLSADGCTIYFARDLGSYNYDIFAATALPP